MTARRPSTLAFVFTIEAVDPSDPVADRIIRAYMADVASRWYGRPATTEEVDQALIDEPYDDLRGRFGALLIALEAGHGIGCAGVRFTGDYAELTKFFTLPDHRGRGVGSRLLQEIERTCGARAVGTIRLDTRAELKEACALYERSGFERVDAFNDEPYSDRWYTKPLNQSVLQPILDRALDVRRK